LDIWLVREEPDALDATDELRGRDLNNLAVLGSEWPSVEDGALSPQNVGGVIISWVWVSVRMNVNLGTSSSTGVSASTFSFFFSRSLKGISSLDFVIRALVEGM
jgi:hypothetical protein